MMFFMLKVCNNKAFHHKHMFAKVVCDFFRLRFRKHFNLNRYNMHGLCVGIMHANKYIRR